MEVDLADYMDLADLNERLKYVNTAPKEVHKGNWVKPIKVDDVMYWHRGEVEAWIKMTLENRVPE